MSAKQIIIVVLGAVVGSVLVMVVLHLLGFRTTGALPAGAIGGIAGAVIANNATRRT